MLHYPKEYLDDIAVRLAYHSTGIEGNSLTLGETRQVILQGTINTPHRRTLREIYEVDNHKDAFQKLLNDIANHQSMSMDTVLDLHYELTKNTIATPGQFKQSSNYITGADFTTVSPQEAPYVIKQWVDNLNYRLSQTTSNSEYLAALMEAHVQFERYHAFEDGNGRTGRLITNYYLAEKEMPFLVIKRDDRDDYISLMANNDVPGLINYAHVALAEESKRYDAFAQQEVQQKNFERRQKLNQFHKRER